MKAIKLLAVAIVLTFSSCSESDSDICREQCYEIIRVENNRRACSYTGSCTYNFKVTFKNQCSGELEYKTSNYRPLADKPKVGDIECSWLGYR
jgi:hypothetical protein